MTVTRGEQMLALRRARMAASPAFLRGGFRPFFLLAAAWAPLALTLWLLALAGAVALPGAMDAFWWHRHEMLFAFVGAAAAGYVLTAIPNWTGRLPVAGLPLLLLAALWVAGRAALLWSDRLGLLVAASIDVAFLLALALAAAREVRAGKGRNAAIVAVLVLLAAASALDHAEAAGMPIPAGLGVRAAIGLITMLIVMIGGRIIPSFTRNWLAKQGDRSRLPGQPGRFDKLAASVTAAALLGWTAAPEARAAGALLLLAGAAQLLRLTRWSGWRSWREPMVLMLHVAYLWIPVGLLLLGAGAIGFAVPATASIHALTAGAMASMILAVMTRFALSQTGREPSAGPATVLLYLLIALGALLRVGAPLGLLDYTAAMRFAALAWGGAFLLFLIAYGPILVRHRRGDPTQ